MGNIIAKLVFSLVCSGFIVLSNQPTLPEKMNIMEWICPGAFDIQKKGFEEKKMQFLYYKINDDYPSVKVYEYYADVLKAQNYDEMHWANQNLGVWFSFIDGTTKGTPLVHEFRAIWADEGEKEMFILSLRYYSKSDLKQDEPDNRIQHVHFQKRPFINLSKGKREIAKNECQGHVHEIMT